MKTVIFNCGGLLALYSLASVPLSWTVETSRRQPVAFDVMRGETLALEASFNNYGKPLAIEGDAALYYQTNGMGDVWWSIPAQTTSNRISAVFTPADDPGASMLKCFLGGPESSYRAAFSLRFLHAPGASPNMLPLPEYNWDVNLRGEPTINGTNLTDYVSAIVTATAPRPANYISTNTVCDIVTNEVQTGYTDWIITPAAYNGKPIFVARFLDAWYPYIVDEDGSENIIGDTIGNLASVVLHWEKTDIQDCPPPGTSWLELSATRSPIKKNALGLARLDDIPDLSGFVKNTRKVAGKPLSEDVTLGPGDVGAASKCEIDEIWNYMMAENFRVVVTNYDSTTHAPEASYEYRMSTNEAFRVVWAETNGLARTHAAATNDALKAAKAEIAKPENRAWGNYDSTTGARSPEGIVQVSAVGGLMISGGMGYTSVSAADAEYWVLSSTDPTLCRSGTNGVFEIIDSSGNIAISIKRGDKRLVPAPPSNISVKMDDIQITYIIESDEHPYLECATSVDGPWFETGSYESTFESAVWTGSSGAWIATIPRGSNPIGFFRSTYYTGGSTVVSYGDTAIDMPRIRIGNVEYAVGTATIDGHTVLTLEAR